MKNTTLAGLGLAFLLSTGAFAAPTAYTVDPVHSNITFSIRHLVSYVEGRFKDFAGTINYDPANVAGSTVNFTVKADSIFTDNDKRDGHLKGADFFDVAKYPTLEFKSRKVIPRGKDKFEVVGDMTVHGVTKGQTVSVTALGTSPGMGGGTVAGFQTEFEIKRSDYGITWNRNLDSGSGVLGDEVKVRINVEASAK